MRRRSTGRPAFAAVSDWTEYSQSGFSGLGLNCSGFSTSCQPCLSTPMRAGLCIQALAGYAQAFHGPAADQMLLNDSIGIVGLDIPVPDGLRVDHHRGTVLALVKAAGLVDADTTAKAGFFGELLEPRVQIAFSIAGAGGPRRIGGTRVVADKDVAFEGGQAVVLLSAVLLNTGDSRVNPRVHGASDLGGKPGRESRRASLFANRAADSQSIRGGPVPREAAHGQCRTRTIPAIPPSSLPRCGGGSQRTALASRSWEPWARRTAARR